MSKEDGTMRDGGLRVIKVKDSTCLEIYVALVQQVVGQIALYAFPSNVLTPHRIWGDELASLSWTQLKYNHTLI